MNIYLCCSSGWDNASTEIWRAYKTKHEAEDWRLKIKKTDDEWNGCNFDAKIKKRTEATRRRLGVKDSDGKYDDGYAGDPYWTEVELLG